MNSLQGQLLVASPHLSGTPFDQTVILLLEHSTSGAFGVVLNRPTNERVDRFWRQIGGKACKSGRRVHFGGPVSGPVVALHGYALLSEKEIPPGLFVAASREHLEQLVQQTEIPYQIYIGHAGWTQGQLEREIGEGIWLTMPARPEYVFDDDADLWMTLVRRARDQLFFAQLGIKHIPDDPESN